MAGGKQLLETARTGRDPFAVLRQMTAELERGFGAFPGFRWPSFIAGAEPAWSPNVDVFEKDRQLVARVDLPGLKKEDVTVEVVDGHLMLSGERRRESEEHKDRYYRIEREFGRFSRAILLPEGIKADAITATFNDGVLEVRAPLPENAAAAPVRVPVAGPAQPAA